MNRYLSLDVGFESRVGGWALSPHWLNSLGGGANQQTGPRDQDAKKKPGRRASDALPAREARKMAASQQQASAASSAASVSGPGSAGGSGPQQQPQPPTQLVGPAQSGLLQQQQQDFDPVQRYKMLIPQLKESLQVIGREIWLCDTTGAGGGTV